MIAPPEVVETTHLLREYLNTAIVDQGTIADEGHGMGEACLDFTVNGKHIRAVISEVAHDQDA